MSSTENTVSEKSSEEASELKATTEIPDGSTVKEANPPGRSASYASSGSNPESLSTFAEQTLAAIVQRDSTVFNSSPDPIVPSGSGVTGDKPEKESESCLNTITPVQPPSIENKDKITQEHLCSSSEDDTEQQDTLYPCRPALQDLYSTDASENEELLDGSGVSGPVLRGVSAAHISVPSASQENGEENEAVAVLLPIQLRNQLALAVQLLPPSTIVSQWKGSTTQVFHRDPTSQVTIWASRCCL